MLLRSLALVLVAALAVPVRSYACGPDFPRDFLRDRDTTLLGLPDGSFTLEMRRLVPRPAETFVPVEGGDPWGARDGGGARETALYLQGATAFEAHRIAESRRAFAAVLALPASDRRRFTTFAAFMLARTEATPDAARAAFAKVRDLAREGFDDPLGLAVASYGEEARRWLADGDDAAAVQLYAQQAALGSDGAVTSLLFVASAIANDADRLTKALREPILQRLLATWAWTRSFGGTWEPNPVLEVTPALIDRLAQVPNLEGADHLAAAAYRAGRFEVAGKLAEARPSALASWVRAKLALRKGDRVTADQLLEEAATQFPEGETWGGWEWYADLHPRARIASDRAALCLAKEAWREALDQALASGAWWDIALVAERVLTVDELLQYVRDRFPLPVPHRTLEWGESHPPSQLRALLARRLLREGRWADAAKYFDPPGLRAQAVQFGALVTRSRSGDADVDRAEAAWEAARLARASGLELLGTEVAPDWAVVGAFYDVEPPDPPKAQVPGAPLVTPAESARVQAHGPPHPDRYHYRRTALTLAEQAASLVPPRSQAYATLLCHAARFATDVTEERRLWQEYVRKGALTPAIRSFGHDCDPPDFERIRHPAAKPRAWPRKRTWVPAVGGVLVGVGTLLVFLSRRRARS